MRGSKNAKKRSGNVLSFLYKCKLGKLIRPAVTCRCISKLASLFVDSKFSRYWINSFINKNQIDMTQFEVPTGGYGTFNEFFYRKLKSGMRDIDSNQEVCVSPADGRLLIVESISNETPFLVKNLRFDLFKFVKEDNLAREFLGGTLVLFRLSPQDYHRFHFPFDCSSSAPRIINGKFESVNPVVYNAGVQPLTENERHLIVLNSDKFDKVVFATVGAMFVGKIIETYKPGGPSLKGGEMGYFAFGGSSVVMIFKKDQIRMEDLFMQNSYDGVETVVKMGQRIAIKK